MRILRLMINHLWGTGVMTDEITKAVKLAIKEYYRRMRRPLETIEYCGVKYLVTPQQAKSYREILCQK